MDTQELEEMLEGSTETPNVEFKNTCAWDVKIFAKDILAISNLQDGGYIVVGVEDQTFIRKGIASEHKLTFKIDVMKDQMASYADPHVNFTLEFPIDKQGIEYAVIRVLSFSEIPIICKKDGLDLRAGVLYYRNSNRRTESAAISNSYDMRNIIELAVVRMMQRKVSVGFTVSPSIENKFDEELKGL